MKHIKLFEEEVKRHFYNFSYEELMGKILHRYGSIPLLKQKGMIVIKKIIYPDYFKLGQDINLTHESDHDKARFVDYFDSLITSKETRGHNFEGFLAGIYNGDLSKPGSKYDIIIDDLTWSVKFVDNPSKAPEIGSFQIPLKEQRIDNLVADAGGLTNLFKDTEKRLFKLRKNVWEIISSGITGGWLVAYPLKTDDEYYIKVNIIDLKSMRNILYKGLTVAPKGGFKSLFSLALSARYKELCSDKFKIIIPQLTKDELLKIYVSEEEDDWAKDVFGRAGYKIRPDVIRYIKNNAKDIGQKLLSFNDFKE